MPFDHETLSVLVEGSYEQYSYNQSASYGIDGTNIGNDATGTSRIIGVNALILYPYERWYFLGGAGLARVSGSGNVSSGALGVDASASASQIKFNVTAGAGMNITELLFAEVRWSHQGADLAVTVGVKIH